MNVDTRENPKLMKNVMTALDKVTSWKKTTPYEQSTAYQGQSGDWMFLVLHLHEGPIEATATNVEDMHVVWLPDHLAEKALKNAQTATNVLPM